MSDAGPSSAAPPAAPPVASSAPSAPSEPAKTARGRSSRHRSKSKHRQRPPGQGARAATFVRSYLPEWPRISGPEAALALAIILGPLAIGAVHVPTRLALSVLLTGALAWAAFRMNRDEQRMRAGWIGLGLLVALAWTFFQWVPLPMGLVELLHPQAAEAARAARAITGAAEPSWLPLTLDMSRTASAFATLLAVTAAYLLAASLRRDADVKARIVIYIELAALVVLGVGALHEVLGLHQIYGVYQSSIDLGGVPFLTSFVNPNHAAALMLLGSLAALGTSLAPDRHQRWHLAVGIALAVGVAVSMSRANAILLVVGIVLVALPALFMRRHREMRGRAVRLVVGTALCLFVAVILIGPERWAAEFQALDSEDFGALGVVTHCWHTGLDAALAAPWTGVGNGALGLATAFSILDWNGGLVSYAHEGLIQVGADLGLVVGGLVLALVLGGFAACAWRAAKDLAAWGLAVALLAVGLQNMVDFSLWVPGVGIAAVAMLGVLVHATWPSASFAGIGPKSPEGEGHARTRRGRGGRWQWRWPLGASATLVGALGLTARFAWQDRPEAWQGAMESALERKAPNDVDRAAIAVAHPADFMAMELAAALADAQGRGDEAWLYGARALALAPFEPQALEAQARRAAARGDDAAAATYIEGIASQGGNSGWRALQVVLSLRTRPGLLERYFSKDARRAIDAAAPLLEKGDVDAARHLLAWAIARFPNDLRVYEAFGTRIADDLKVLGRLADECLGRAGLATDPHERSEWERLGYLFQGRVELAGVGTGKEQGPVRAWFLFLSSAERAPAEAPERAVEALLLAGKAAERVGRSEWMNEAIERLSRLPINPGWPRGEYHILRSKRAEMAGDLGGAIREMQDALRFLGHVPWVHDRLADLFLRTDDTESGERARQRANEARALEAMKRTTQVH